MTRTEYDILQALNIASTIYRRPKHDFEATAAEVAKVYLADTGEHINPRSMAARLRNLKRTNGWPSQDALVEKLPANRWRLTSHACRVLNA